MSKRRRRPENHPGVARLIAQASANEAQETREMHIVPLFYLKRWAEDGKVRVTEIKPRTTRLRPPRKATTFRVSGGTPGHNP